MYKNCCVEYVVVFTDGEIVDIYICIQLKLDMVHYCSGLYLANH